MPTDLVVFDLDGTLVDSRKDLADSANQVLVEYGGQPHSEEAIGRMVGDGAATLVARAFAASRCPQPADALSRFLAIYNGRLLDFTRPYPGVAELLDALAGRAALAVLTNKPLGPTRAILDGLGLAGYFGARVLGGDGPHPRKPDPGGLHTLMQAAHATAAATLMVGDSEIDWRTAQAGGVRACLVRYGFGFGGVAIDALRSEDAVIDQPAGLLALL